MNIMEMNSIQEGFLLWDGNSEYYKVIKVHHNPDDDMDEDGFRYIYSVDAFLYDSVDYNNLTGKKPKISYEVLQGLPITSDLLEIAGFEIDELDRVPYLCKNKIYHCSPMMNDGITHNVYDDMTKRPYAKQFVHQMQKLANDNIGR